MLNENIPEGYERVNDITAKKGGLCEKFDIPANKLDFNYISQCRDAKELERILKILR